MTWAKFLATEAEKLCQKKIHPSDEDIERHYYSLCRNDVYDKLFQFKEIVRQTLVNKIPIPKKNYGTVKKYHKTTRIYLEGECCASFLANQIRNYGLNSDSY